MRTAPGGDRSESTFGGAIVDVEPTVEGEGDQQLVPLIEQVGDALLQGLASGNALSSWARERNSPRMGRLRSRRSSRRWEALSAWIRASASMR